MSGIEARVGGPEIPIEEIVSGEVQKGLKDEIERKFIINSPPADYRSHPFQRIVQGYTEDGTRYRKAYTGEGNTFTRTRKFGNGLVRQEEEVIIGEVDFNEVWNQTNGRRVQKTRYLIPYGEGTTIHLDIYEGKLAGRIVAEPEFDSVELANAFVAPDWFRSKKGKFREVTGVKQYSNKRLASNGWPKK